jgi:hypothetical protein
MFHEGRKRNSRLTALAMVLVGMAMVAAACGSDSNNHATKRLAPLVTPTPTATPTPGVSATGSGLFVVDCIHNRAYVPLINSPAPGNGNGRVAVVDLSLDPNTSAQSIPPVTFSHTDLPTGAAFDAAKNLVTVVSGSSNAGGFADVIDTTTSPPSLVSGSPFTFPTGSEPGGTGQVLFDPVHNLAQASVLDNFSCPSAGTCTGFVSFDDSTHAFGSVLQAPYAETFALNPGAGTAGQIADGSDNEGSGAMTIADLGLAKACLLSDINIGGDHDGVSYDTTTNIFVLSHENGTAAVINMNGSTASGNPCTITEGGTNPNSVRVTGLPGGTAGSAVNPVTHQAFLIEDGSPGVSLIGLPYAPVAQIQSSMLGKVVSALPNDPNGNSWATQGDPYAVAVDTCHNLGYAVSSDGDWLVQVDLAKLQSTPGKITTTLPAGTCAGTTTTFGCDNGNGVKFFPLPPETGN